MTDLITPIISSISANSTMSDIRADGSRPLHEIDIRYIAERLIKDADKAGYVLTIEQVPQLPLAMRNYKSVVNIRQKRY